MLLACRAARVRRARSSATAAPGSARKGRRSSAALIDGDDGWQLDLRPRFGPAAETHGKANRPDRLKPAQRRCNVLI